MKLSSLARRFTGRQHPVVAEAERALLDDRIEREGAALCDANLARLRHTDPDAARIFTTGTTPFGDAYRNPALQDQLAEQIKDYAVAKHTRSEMHLYNQLFAGI